MTRKRTMPIAEETYLYEKVQDPGLNIGGGHELRKEDLTRMQISYIIEGNNLDQVHYAIRLKKLEAY